MKWRPIKEFNGLYLVNALGDVYSVRSDKLLTPRNGNRGYKVVNITVDGVHYNRDVHRLVALSFIENPQPEQLTQVNHIDGVKHHNWVSNLEWVDPSGNMKHAFRLGLGVVPAGSKNGFSKLNEAQVLTIRKKYVEGVTPLELRKEYGLHRSTIKNIVKGKSWKHV